MNQDRKCQGSGAAAVTVSWSCGFYGFFCGKNVEVFGKAFPMLEKSLNAGSRASWTILMRTWKIKTTRVTWVAVTWLIRLHPEQEDELFVWSCEYESVCADLPGADTDCWRVHPSQEEPSYASVNRRECLLRASTQRQLQLWSKGAGPCLKLAAELSNLFNMGFEGMKIAKLKEVWIAVVWKSWRSQWRGPDVELWRDRLGCHGDSRILEMMWL